MSSHTKAATPAVFSADNSLIILPQEAFWEKTLVSLSHSLVVHSNMSNRAYHVSEVCTEGASGLVILHHTVVVEDFSTAFTTKAEESN